MKSIQKGDMEQVVKASPCCHSERDIGYIFVVDSIATIAGMCNYCGQQSEPLNVAYEGDGAWDVYRLQRIEPLDEADEISELTSIAVYEELSKETI